LAVTLAQKASIRLGFSVVLSKNDNVVIGAIEAIGAMGKQGEIAVSGIDAILMRASRQGWAYARFITTH